MLGPSMPSQDERRPRPGTYGALTRSDTPLNWRRLLEKVTFTPDQLIDRLIVGWDLSKELADELRQEGKLPPRDALQSLLGPLQSADPLDFQNDRDPSWPSLDETLQWEPNGLPTWWPKSQHREHWNPRQVLLRNLRENLPTSLTTPKTNAERQEVVDSLRRIYAGLISGASGILSS